MKQPLVRARPRNDDSDLPTGQTRFIHDDWASFGNPITSGHASGTPGDFVVLYDHRGDPLTIERKAIGYVATNGK